MESFAQEMRFQVDLTGGFLEQPQSGKLMRGDKNAASVITELYKDKTEFDASGVTVTGKFSRADGVDIQLSGEASGNEASVTLDEHCFAVAGRYELRIRLTMDEITRTILFISGYVESDGEGGILDVENVIPSIDDIVAQYAEMKRITQETAAARDAALLAAQSANFQILDRYDTLDLLYAAHPTGEAGQAYAVGSEEENVVYVWGVDTLAWVNIGKVQGPRGFQGPQGIQGEPGPSYDQSLNTTDDVTFKSVTADVVYGAVFME